MIQPERSVLWHEAVAEFLSDLSAVQESLLAEVGQRHHRLPSGNEPPLAAKASLGSSARDSSKAASAWA